METDLLNAVVYYRHCGGFLINSNSTFNPSRKQKYDPVADNKCDLPCLLSLSRSSRKGTKLYVKCDWCIKKSDIFVISYCKVTQTFFA